MPCHRFGLKGVGFRRTAQCRTRWGVCRRWTGEIPSRAGPDLLGRSTVAWTGLRARPVMRSGFPSRLACLGRPRTESQSFAPRSGFAEPSSPSRATAPPSLPSGNVRERGGEAKKRRPAALFRRYQIKLGRRATRRRRRHQRRRGQAAVAKHKHRPASPAPPDVLFHGCRPSCSATGPRHSSLATPQKTPRLGVRRRLSAGCRLSVRDRPGGGTPPSLAGRAGQGSSASLGAQDACLVIDGRHRIICR